MLEGHAVLSDHVYFPFQDQRGHAGLQIYCVCVCSNKVILITDVHKCIWAVSDIHLGPYVW